MNQRLPPPIGANRVDKPDHPDEGPAVSGLSSRTRLIAAALVLALAIGAGVIGYRVIAGGDDNEGGGVGGAADWNAIAVQDFESGEVTIFDPDGEELESYESDVELGRLESSGPYLLVGHGEEAVIIDARSGERRELTIGDSEEARFIGRPSPIVAISQRQGSNVRLVDAESGADVDVGDVGDLTDPRILLEAGRFDPDSGVIGLIDEGSSQSLLVEVQDDEKPTFLPGRVGDVSFGSAVAVQPVGPRTTVTLYDAASGDDLGSVEIDGAARVWLTDADTALALTWTGELLRVTAEREEPEQVASFDLDVTQGPAINIRDAQRLVLDDREGSVVVAGWDGEEILRTEGTVAFPVGANVDNLRCIVVATDDEASGDDEAGGAIPGDQTAQLIDLETGEKVGDSFAARPEVLLGSVDGCAVSSFGTDGSAVFVNADASFEVDNSTGQVSPDGEAFLVRGQDRTFELRRFDDLAAEPVELPEGVASFVDRS